MKKLLVGSIYAPDPRNETWLRLQLQFLKKTVGDFDHVVILNRVDPKLFRDSKVLYSIPVTEAWGTNELTKAMDTLMRYFIENDGYRDYLMIDSDAFPAQAGWIDQLYHLMEERPNHGLSERMFACPVRPENLDRFPHGCAFFAKGAWFRQQQPEKFSWEYMPGTNFMGETIKDVTFKDASAVTDAEGRQVWLPLMRTNTINLHPILGAMYGHLFYHHGAGSRPPQFRAVLAQAYDNFADQAYTDRRNVEMFRALKRDPARSVRRLMTAQPASRGLFAR
jgi:hypothetical protein